MADLSSLSTEDLMKMYQPPTAAPSGDLSGMSTEQLMALYQPQQAPVAPAAQIDPTDTANIVTMQNPHGQGLKQVAEDYLTQIAHNVTFGLADKAAAKMNEFQGKGTYDEMLAKNRALTQAAGERIGTGGQIASALAGGGLAASALGNAGITVAGRLAPTAGIIPRTIAGGVEGAGYGAAYGAGNTDTGNPEDYVKNAIQGAKTGGVIGAAIPAALSVGARAITPAPAQSAERLRRAQALQAAGVPVTAADRTGSVALAKLEDQTGKMPLGKLFADPAKGQMEAVTARAAERSGIPVGQVPTEDVLQKGFQRIGSRIGNLQERYPIQFDEHLMQNLADTHATAQVLGKNEQGIVNSFINRILKPGATLEPAAMQALRTDLRLSIQKGPDAKPLFNREIANLRDALDDALNRTIQRSGNPAHVADLATARQQYANLNVLQDALYRSGAQGQLGILTPTALQTAQASSLGKAGYMQGRGELTELAKGSSALLRAPQDSHTASNVATMNPLKWMSSLGGQALITNPIAQRYWGNQLLPKGAANEAAPPVIAGLLAARDAQQRRKGLLSP